MIFVCIIFAYLLGSISSSYIAGRVAAGVDIREFGSGNAGATNSLRVLGWRVGLLVFIADIVKGVLAIAFAHLVTNGGHWSMALAGLAAVVGHNWPIYFQFRGGKGVATTIGVLLTLAFVPAIYAGVVALAALALTRYVSLGSLLLVTLTPVFALFMHIPGPFVWVAFFLAVLTYWRHKGNIERLLRGEERRLFGK